MSTQEVTNLWLSTIDAHAEYWRQDYLEVAVGNHSPLIEAVEETYSSYRDSYTFLASLQSGEGDHIWADAVQNMLNFYTMFITEAVLSLAGSGIGLNARTRSVNVLTDMEVKNPCRSTYGYEEGVNDPLK